MADVVFDPSCNDFNDLYGKGYRAYALQDYDAAVLAFSKAAELLAKQYNDDLHDSLGDVYLYYGKSLLQLARKQGNPIGENVLQADENTDDDDEEIIEETSQENKNETEEKQYKEKADSAEENKTENKGESENKQNENKEESGENVEEGQEEKEEDCTDLQVAWEVLELAKTIFTRRGNDGKKNLAETLIMLGEISLESNMFNEGIEDMKKGLEIQKTLYGNDSRLVAETFYKIGMTLGLANQHQDAIESFNNCIEYLKNRLKSIEENDKDKEEIQEIKDLIPEIEERIADAKNFKEEMVKEIASAINNGRETSKSVTNGAGSSTTATTKVNDISHLVKRKRKSEESAETAEINPSKKLSL